MKKAIRFTSAAVIALVLSGKTLYASDLGKMSSLNKSHEDFESIVKSEKQTMYLLDDTAVKSGSEEIASTIGTESKGTAVQVLGIENGKSKIITSSGSVGYVGAESLTDTKKLIFNDADETEYANADDVSVRLNPDDASEEITQIDKNDEVHIIGRNEGSAYVKAVINGQTGYIREDALMMEKEVEKPAVVVTPAVITQTVQSSGAVSAAAPAISSWNGAVLSSRAGTIMGPSGKETYYNLNMSGVVSIMNAYGYTAADYAVRADGVKTLGGYVMVAANLGTHPRGTTVQTSLGTGLVCDTGGFASADPNQLDIAVNW